MNRIKVKAEHWNIPSKDAIAINRIETFAKEPIASELKWNIRTFAKEPIASELKRNIRTYHQKLRLRLIALEPSLEKFECGLIVWVYKHWLIHHIGK